MEKGRKKGKERERIDVKFAQVILFLKPNLIEDNEQCHQHCTQGSRLKNVKPKIHSMQILENIKIEIRESKISSNGTPCRNKQVSSAQFNELKQDDKLWEIKEEENKQFFFQNSLS